MQLSLDELIASIGQSVSSAQGSIENHSLGRFLDYFEAEPSDGENDLSLKPKTIKMSLPSSDDMSKTATVDVPLSALAHHKQVQLDKVTVKVKARLNQSDNMLMADMGAPIKNECADQSDPDSDVGEITLTFNVGDCSEGVARVVQNITKTI